MADLPLSSLVVVTGDARLNSYEDHEGKVQHGMSVMQSQWTAPWTAPATPPDQGLTAWQGLLNFSSVESRTRVRIRIRVTSRPEREVALGRHGPAREQSPSTHLREWRWLPLRGMRFAL